MKKCNATQKDRLTKKTQSCKLLYKVPYLHEGEVVSLINAMHFLTINKQVSKVFVNLGLLIQNSESLLAVFIKSNSHFLV